MVDAQIKFEREERDGIVAVGTYLIDAAGRLGIEIEDECGRRGLCDECAVKITKGGEFLSELTKSEIEHLSEKRRKDGERLACQAKIEKSGEVSVMTKEKKVEESPNEKNESEEYRKKFEKMPLDEKISSLFELEMIALGETISYVFNSPYEFGGKIMSVLANFGRKMEDEVKEATRPKEHKSDAKTAAPKAKAKKTPAARKTAGKKTTAKKAASKKPADKKGE